MTERIGQTYYEILDVRADASFDEIEASYRGMSAILGVGSLAMYSMMEEEDVAQLRAQVDEAYRTLRDPERRAQYDRSIGRTDVSYPTLVVPETPSDSHVTMGHVVTGSMSDSTALVPLAQTGPSLMPTPPAPTPPSNSPPPAATVAPAVEPAPPTLPTTKPAAVVLAPVVKPDSVLPPPETAKAKTGTPEIPTMKPGVAARATPLPPPSSRPLAASPAFKQLRKLHPKPDFEITSETEYTGALLRRLRESAGASLEELGDITKVSKRYLRALEDSDFASLPAAVYVRGFVSEYARALGLDTQVVCKSYMAVYKKFKGEGG